MKEVSLNFWKKFRYILTGLGICAGLFLTILSLANVCHESCLKGHSYRLLSLPFEWIGLFYFIPLLISFLLSKSSPLFSLFTGLMLAAGIGSEVMFILIQKYVIGSWCLLCLGIAASIFVSASSWAIDYFFELQSTIFIGHREKILKRIKRAILMLSATAGGFLIAFVGVSKQEQALESVAFEQKILFGNQESPIEIYVFTSWSCPACHRYEPTLEKLIPNLEEQARVIFVDYGVDDTTLNYLPYHLSFMMHNKDHYIALRSMLKKLSTLTETPTDEDVAVKAKELGVDYKQLSYSDVAIAIDYFKNLATQLNVAYLPSFVIMNTKTKKQEILSGSKVTPDDIQAVIRKL